MSGPYVLLCVLSTLVIAEDELIHCSCFMCEYLFVCVIHVVSSFPLGVIG